MSNSAVGEPIFEITSTEDKTKMSTPMLSGLGKTVVFFGYLDASAFPESSCDGFTTYSGTSISGGFNF